MRRDRIRLLPQSRWILANMESLVFSVIQLLLIISNSSFASPSERVTRPVVGILALPNGDHHTSQTFPASYVKFAQLGGARVMPIFGDQSQEYYEKVVALTNGVIFTGGGLNLTESTAHIRRYIRDAQTLFNLAKQKNLDGSYYPVFGICLGFELMVTIAAENQWLFDHCDYTNVALNLSFVGNPRHSRIMRNASWEVINTLNSQNSTMHYHEWCLNPEVFNTSSVGKFFSVVATSKREANLESISIIEAENFPFYGTSFHPERVIFEQYPSTSHSNTPSYYEAVVASQYFANFFSKEVRKSSHKIPENADFWRVLIDRVNPVYRVGKGANSLVYYFHTKTISQQSRFINLIG